MINPRKVSLSTGEKISLLSNLSTMLSAGIPILEATNSMLEDSKGNSKKVIQVLIEDLMQGNQINVAFGKFPLIFDTVTVNLIKAAEETGNLDIVLKDIISNIRKDVEFSDRIKSAMIYPVFIFGVLIAVVLMILIVVVPKLTTVFARLNMPLPITTKVMMYASDLLLKQTVPSIAVVALFITALIYLYKKEKRVMLHLLTSLPFLSALARKIDLTRFFHNMSLLLGAGIPIGAALDLTEHVVVKKEMSEAIRHCREGVTSGKTLSSKFKERNKLFPSIAIKITEAGEKTGQLDKSMQDASDFLEYQVTSNLKLVTALIEPIMLVLVGIVVGGMMLSIIAPIYGMISQVGGK